ncbi:diguanylate phosphodiesterase [Pseudidiomarina sp. 1APR75-33.1]|uniref:diguanylate phosphodiesterase n=1 Tax=Pseudidiomarina terrestris TaxID=2820060 RepID=UPI0026562202|nr:diguanylate phosphodiesterase [Pseudidiomarina sp. 1APR75-33.1]MDN7127401.1 diguanylate phosphodiesterase [Pseudidiomarina sp. 1APR75-33.1]
MDDYANTLTHIIYVSTASDIFNVEQLPALLEECRARNQRVGVTGMLMFSGNSFFQIIEGDESVVQAVYSKIETDPRHYNVVKILEEPISKRAFGEWILRFCVVDQEALTELGADYDEMLDEVPLTDSRRAEKLVTAFTSGKWTDWLQRMEQSALTKDTSDISFAFQPIVDVTNGKVLSYEALVRGPNGEPASAVFGSIAQDNLYSFDFHCRKVALDIAKECGITTNLNLNFTPGAAAIEEFGLDRTLSYANEIGFPQEQIIFEATENEAISDYPSFVASVKRGKRYGVELAIDDFGAGYAGLQLLSEFYPDYVKFDMALVRDIHRSGPRQAVARAIIQLCDELGISVIVEGVETVAEYHWFRSLGITFFQGYLFAKPLFEGLPRVKIPKVTLRAAEKIQK